MIKNTSPILTALRAASNSEPLSVAFMEQQRWGDAPACPVCGSLTVYQMQSMSGGREKNYRWRCRDCKKMYTVRTGTIFEETRLPMRVWVFAFWQACASKKGISALQLARETEITHKSALFVLRRIRHGLSADMLGTVTPKLTGTVESMRRTSAASRATVARQRTGAARRKLPWLAWSSVAAMCAFT